MAQKYVVDINGNSVEQEFAATSAGAADAGRGVGLNSDGLVDSTMLPSGISEARMYVAKEAILVGDLLNIFDDAGVSKVRKAIATGSAMQAHRVALTAAAAGAQVKADRTGILTSSALVPGKSYFLSESTSGGFSPTKPTTAPTLNKIRQKIGFALSATELQIRIEDVLILA